LPKDKGFRHGQGASVEMPNRITGQTMFIPVWIKETAMAQVCWKCHALIKRLELYGRSKEYSLNFCLKCCEPAPDPRGLLKEKEVAEG